MKINSLLKKMRNFLYFSPFMFVFGTSFYRYVNNILEDRKLKILKNINFKNPPKLFKNLKKEKKKVEKEINQLLNKIFDETKLGRQELFEILREFFVFLNSGQEDEKSKFQELNKKLDSFKLEKDVVENIKKVISLTKLSNEYANEILMKKKNLLQKSVNLK